jgi:hypothetical protein
MVSDLWMFLTDVFGSLGMYAQIAAIVIAVLFGLFMSEFGAIINMTFGALIVFVIAQLVIDIAVGGADVIAALDNMWVEAGYLTLHEVLAFAGAFFVVIFVVWLLKSIFSSD